ncbi:SHOCT domain-containing protein [Oenococcus oeni]|uniref:SHOCT domain-containing protein n=1 Tax=Oenococcus oeni TaxID=1247 RepID=UPI0004D4ED9F|nr:SHOCT domain-containing protein [Oenococcus oeni]KER96969.1 hypothetical protein HT64_09775 [Oenococcus oeni]
MLVFIIIIFILGIIYKLYKDNQLLYSYAPNVNIDKKAIDKNGEKYSYRYFLKVLNKVRNGQPISDYDNDMIIKMTGLDKNGYIKEEKERIHRTTIYIPSNGVPYKGASKIRETTNGLIYFSNLYQEKPTVLFKILEYGWTGPQYSRSYSTTSTSKNKHLIPIVNQKRTASSNTTETKTEEGSLARIVLLRTDTNEKIVSESIIKSFQNNIISAFKIWEVSNPITKKEKKKSIASSLRELKSLLDDEIITKEEFKAKKKQVLGL